MVAAVPIRRGLGQWVWDSCARGRLCAVACAEDLGGLFKMGRTGLQKALVEAVGVHVGVCVTFDSAMLAWLNVWAGLLSTLRSPL